MAVETTADLRRLLEAQAQAHASGLGHDLHPWVPDGHFPQRSHTACKVCGRRIDIDAVQWPHISDGAATSPCTPRV